MRIEPGPGPRTSEFDETKKIEILDLLTNQYIDVTRLQKAAKEEAKQAKAQAKVEAQRAKTVLAEEKKAEALKQMNSMPQELDLKRHGPDGYGHGCRDGRGMPQSNSRAGMPNRDAHPKQVRKYQCLLAP